MPKDLEVAAALLRENHDLGNEICGLQEQGSELKAALRALYDQAAHVYTGARVKQVDIRDAALNLKEPLDAALDILEKTKLGA